MRAWVSSQPGIAALRLETVSLPRPAAGQGLIKVEAAALNFADTLMLDDKYQVKPPRPFIPGQEVAGMVMEAGDGFSFPPGTRVAGKLLWGGFAAFALLRGDMAIAIPADVEAAMAAALPVSYTTALVALGESVHVKRGTTILVLAAAGAAGLAAIDIARCLGLRVIAAAGGAEKCAIAAAQGADATVDYRHPDWGKAVEELTGGKGVDAVFDPVGGAAAETALRLLAWEGKYLIVGFASGTVPKLAAHRLLLKRASAIGVYWDHDRDQDMLGRVQASLSRYLADGAIKPLVGQRFGFDELPAALDALKGGRSHGKLILMPESTPHA